LTLPDPDDLKRTPPVAPAPTAEAPDAAVASLRGAGVIQYYCKEATSLEEIDPHVAAWKDLERRSLGDNFYLSPHVLMANLRQVGNVAPFHVVFVYGREDGGDRMVACAPFSLLAPTSGRPAATLASFASPYSYLSGVLLDRDHAAAALSAIWDWVERPKQPWQLVMLRLMNNRSPTWALLQKELDRRGRERWVKDRSPRAVLKRASSFEAHIARWSTSRRKGYRQNRRRLERLGTVEVVVHRDLVAVPDLAERFMDLEARGWKGQGGTAMAQLPSASAYFTQVTKASDEQGRLFFIELKLDGKPIGMTSNFVVGHTMFAFKSAYDPDFKQCSPGTLAEIETIRMFYETPELLAADGGTHGPSYLDSYWQDQILMPVVYVSTSHFASKLRLRLIRAATETKRALRSRLARLNGAPRLGTVQD